MAHPNEDLLSRGYEAFSAGDLDTVFSIFADDIDYHIAGSNQLTGDYKGHEEVRGFLGKLMELSGGTFRLEVHDILANDTHGAVLVNFHVEREGRSLDGQEVHTWHLSGGKATEFWSFEGDEAAMDAIFA
jgi:hypothetical protein